MGNEEPSTIHAQIKGLPLIYSISDSEPSDLSALLVVAGSCSAAFGLDEVVCNAKQTLKSYFGVCIEKSLKKLQLK